jgi:hypothetical protein
VPLAAAINFAKKALISLRLARFGMQLAIYASRHPEHRGTAPIDRILPK